MMTDVRVEIARMLPLAVAEEYARQTEDKANNLPGAVAAQDRELARRMQQSLVYT